MSYSKKDFISFWGKEGYVETFDGYEFKPEDVYEKAIKPFEDKNKTCLEIGCGGGFWINRYLKNGFKKVIAIDVIPKPNIDCEYFELEDGDYFCTPIQSNSIDFVWCFGVFCHLPNSAVEEYIKNIIRVLKPGGDGVLMFPNWDNHKMLKQISNKEQYKEVAFSTLGWFFIDYESILNNINNNTLWDEFRDALVHIQK